MLDADEYVAYEAGQLHQIERKVTSWRGIQRIPPTLSNIDPPVNTLALSLSVNKNGASYKVSEMFDRCQAGQ